MYDLKYGEHKACFYSEGVEDVGAFCKRSQNRIGMCASEIRQQ